MSKKQPNNLLTPLVIAGITTGFLFSAYRFIFATSEQKAAKNKRDHLSTACKNNEQQKD